jgi:hypothetical protein
MFDPKDNFPEEWPAHVRKGQLRQKQSAFSDRFLLLQFAKYVIFEFLNRSECDIDKIVDDYLHNPNL